MSEMNEQTQKLIEQPKPQNSPVSQITQRETEILNYIKEGMSNSEIAKLISLSSKTIENHVRNIMIKLDANNRTEAVVIALRQDLIQI